MSTPFEVHVWSDDEGRIVTEERRRGGSVFIGSRDGVLMGNRTPLRFRIPDVKTAEEAFKKFDDESDNLLARYNERIKEHASWKWAKDGENVV